MVFRRIKGLYDIRQVDPDVLRYRRRLMAAENADAREYLYSRGFSDQEIEHYGVGLVTAPASELFGRVVFPITDLSGRAVNFQGRVIPTRVRHLMNVRFPEVKYWHRKGVDSSKSLMGLREAAQKIYELDYVYLLEGPVNVMSLSAYGIPAVATLGTGLSIYQAHLLTSLTNNIVLSRDDDRAGRKAVVRDHQILSAHTGASIWCNLAKDGDWNDYLVAGRRVPDPVPYEDSGIS